MTQEITPRLWLTDCISHIYPFRPDIAHTFVERTDKGLMGSGMTADQKTLVVHVRAKTELPEFEHPACFGTLEYLTTILNTAAIKDAGKMDMEFASLDGKQTSLRTVRFSAKRMRFAYNAMAPNAPNLVKPRPDKDAKFAYRVKLTPEVIKDFDTVVRVQKTAGDEDVYFTLKCESGVVTAVLGRRENSSNVELASSVEGDDVSKPVFTTLNTKLFQTILKDCPNGAILHASHVGVRVVSENVYSEYSFILHGKKIV